MKIDHRKAAVIGCGNVGASIAFRFLQQGLFTRLVLLDANRDKAEGEAMDLRDGLPYGAAMEISAGDYDDLTDCALAVITAGANQKPGETRLDLIGLGAELEVDSRNIHAFIIGEHGDSELAVWSEANVSGLDLEDFCRVRGQTLGAENRERLYREVRDSAYQIIERKGATYYGIAMAVGRIAEAIVKDERAVLPVSAVLDGQYGMNGLALSLPSIVGRKGLQEILEMPLSSGERAALSASAEQMREAIESLKL
ncbi:MAG: L-lactate dehydrogenase [Oscillibacter sp.]|nr:L-lactate dehydrogenase [Oscillibacter sp.]